jgi:hypothetical protein
VLVYFPDKEEGKKRMTKIGGVVVKPLNTDEKLANMRRGADRMSKALEGREPSKKDTGIACSTHCGGTIIEDTWYRTKGDWTTIKIGGRNPVEKIVELYCSNCGISYHHLPGTMK